MADFPPARPLGAADVPAVAAIERATFPDPWSARAFLEALGAPDLWCVALDAPDGTLAGYGVCRSAADEGEILNVAVAEAWRGRGAGHILVEAMLRHLAGRGAARVYLEVRASNAAAIGLYASLAFERVGIRRGYYARPREDAVVMAVTVASWRAEKR